MTRPADRFVAWTAPRSVLVAEVQRARDQEASLRRLFNGAKRVNTVLIENNAALADKLRQAEVERDRLAVSLAVEKAKNAGLAADLDALVGVQ